MRPRIALQVLALLLASIPLLAVAQELTAPATIGKPASKVYRQVMPDGKIIYSDKPVKGAKIDETIIPDPANVNTWKSETGKRPVVPPRVESTPVTKTPPLAAASKRKSEDEANTNVIKAEMLLEDARKKQRNGVEPLPGERTGNASGGSRLNEIYNARQLALQRDVVQAEAMLKKAIRERDALQGTPATR
ncbi:hypothetical protein [Noviherbaspirillum saxi]|uniref:DUF4124 domain-containing protein n=1 Tax=Noviherbaspirillum saxi TaxID=2320863 RepID=A0A3A3FYK7_9BURK|nr:hypothetical protein [Noviherbaspirillum saxi]RJF99281.1 hypothetical protein D3871_12685 [Noviherbaspirillum saxi]